VTRLVTRQFDSATALLYITSRILRNWCDFYWSSPFPWWSNIRNTLDAEKAEKLIEIYRFYRAEEDNQ